MRVIWFEVTEPSAYSSGGSPICGWQDSLERIVRTIPNIELVIAFVSENHSEVKVIDGVTYVPIFVQWSFWERSFRRYWDTYVEKMLPAALRIIAKYKPDLIHVFGTEWPFGQIAAHTDIPVVIHIMGAVVPYNNAKYPPNYSAYVEIAHSLFSPKALYSIWEKQRYGRNWEQWEKRTWKLVSNYMGRTQWDKSMSRVMHPGRRYFHVEEALRSDFLSGKYHWQLPSEKKLRLISTGCSTYWKGPDMMLKVAKILTSLGVDFEWQVVGYMPKDIQKTVEHREDARFEDCNVRILGLRNPDELICILCSSSLYVHTAYIENSPNSICEAQCLGLPVISTNVGGIPSLVRHDIEGVLVPANDPWQMADAIIELSNDKPRMLKYSENGRILALERHNDEHIKQQLLDCYNNLANC